jgi:hypothetical protein
MKICYPETIEPNKFVWLTASVVIKNIDILPKVFRKESNLDVKQHIYLKHGVNRISLDLGILKYQL